MIKNNENIVKLTQKFFVLLSNQFIRISPIGWKKKQENKYIDLFNYLIENLNKKIIFIIIYNFIF